jgi:putative transposase
MDNRLKYNPNFHHRKSIRLKGYDYSQEGLYFITICVQNRECLFDKIIASDLSISTRIELNDAGQMVGKWYNELENKFPDIHCHEIVVMPNHFHCIIENVKSVGVDLCICPNKNGTNNNVNHHIKRGQSHRNTPSDEHDLLGEHIGSPLHRVVQWFKTMTTNEYIRGVKNMGWQPFNGKLWQRNYWEHIIRNDESYKRIAEYINNNPAEWINDKLNPQNSKF